MASVQDIETRLIGIEQMIKFVLTMFQVQDPKNPFSRPVTLLEAYYIALQKGLTLAPQVVTEEDLTPIEVHTDTPEGIESKVVLS